MSKKVVLWSMLISIALLAVGAVYAQGSGYDLRWWTIDGGGGMSSGGNYVLTGTAGQPDAAALQGGSYVLYGGFWVPETAQAQRHRIYIPLTKKRDR